MKIKNLKLKIDSYNPSEIELRWQKAWEDAGVYRPDLDKAKRPFYSLMMFPYPSAEGMHVGNMYAFTGADVYGRFMRMQGYDVFEPIGLDGFGIHSENYAIKVGRHPKEQAKISEKNFYRQLHQTGNGFDWSRKLETYDHSYYKWTQWLFIQLFKAGLAYRKKAPVNFCPSCKTVLADEQVVGRKLEMRDGKLEEEVGSGRDDRKSHFTNPASQLVSPTSVPVCERCETEVVKRELEQWFFRITKYAERLLTNIAKLNWSEKVKIAQTQWIGKSEGTLIRFVILSKAKDHAVSGDSSTEPQNGNRVVEVFTTRPDTLFGATFLVVSPEHPLVALLLKGKFEAARPPPFGSEPQGRRLAKLKSYVESVTKKMKQEMAAEGKEKTGICSGLYAINPVNNEKIPVWIADYVSIEYGTGAIMGVPAHDQRDFEFAKKHNLPIRQVILPIVYRGVDTNPPGRWNRICTSGGRELREAYTGEGRVVNSGDEWNGFYVPDAITKIIDSIEKKGIGKREVNYHLRDWLISRQRYWGPPIPLVFCENCARKGQSSMKGWFPVPESELPVELPFIKDYKPLGTSKSPLANHPEFYKTKCPNCKGEARRETDVSDTFLDSSWYFLRYLATEFDDVPFPSETFFKNPKSEARNPKQIQNSNAQNSKQFRISNFDIRALARRARWLPVSMYIGGAEHSVLHLLYARFITMVLKDLGFIEFEEPFTRFYAHGLLVKEGAKMSKSKGNVVIPDEYVKKFGADTLRTYLMFMGPFSQGGDFRDTGIEGMSKFLKRVWTLVSEVLSIKYKVLSKKDRTKDLDHLMHNAIKSVTEDMEKLRYNTAIAHIMEYYNELNSYYAKYSILNTKYCKTLVLLLAPFAPHMTEELWQKLKVESGKLRVKFSIFNSQFSIHIQPWPKYDPKLLEEDEVTIVIQVNGKLRGNIIIDRETSKKKAKIEELAKKENRVVSHLEGKQIKKVIYVSEKVINFVID